MAGSMTTHNRYWISRLRALPLRTSWGDRYWDDVAKHYATDAEWPGRKSAYKNLKNVYFSEGLQAMVLDPWQEGTVQNMSRSQWGNGELTMEVRPKGQVIDADYIGIPPVPFPCTITSTNYIPEGAFFMVAFHRAESRPPGVADVPSYTFNFGKLFSLKWGGISKDDSDPDDKGPIVLSRMESSGLPALDWSFHLTQDKLQDYLARPDVMFEFYQVGPDLLIVSNLLGEWWIRDVMGPYMMAKRPAPIPAGPLSVSGTCGGWAVNLIIPKFPTTGSFDVDVEFNDTYNPDTMLRHALPWQLSDKLDAAIDVVAVNDKTYTVRVTLNSNGVGTTILKAWQIFAKPTFSYADWDWQEITGRVFQARESLGEGLKAHECTVSVYNQQGEFAAYLQGLGDAFTTGDLAFKYEIGYTSGTTTNTAQRMLGIAKVRAQASPVSGAETYTFTAYNRAQLMAQTSLIGCPCLAGSLVKDAIGILAMWSDIPDTDIIYDHTFSTDWLVDDQGRDYAKPNWFIEDGANALETFERFLKAHGLYGRFDGAGKLHVGMLTREPKSPSYTNIFSERKIDPPLRSFKDVSGERSLLDVPNVVMAIGEVNGERAQFSIVDEDSVNTEGTDRFQGRYVYEVINEPELSSIESIFIAALGEYVRLPRGRDIEFNGYHDMQLLRPGDVIGITSETVNPNGEAFRVTSVSAELGITVNTPTVRAREIVEIT